MCSAASAHDENKTSAALGNSSSPHVMCKGCKRAHVQIYGGLIEQTAQQSKERDTRVNARVHNGSKNLAKKKNARYPDALIAGSRSQRARLGKPAAQARRAPRHVQQRLPKAARQA